MCKAAQKPKPDVLLRSGNAELAISPSCGGVLTRWTVAGRHILRPCEPAVRDPLESACFVLAPFSNAIEGGGFQFADTFFAQQRNHPLEPTPIHGDAWLATWRVENCTVGTATLSYEHSARQGFPFRYRVVQHVVLKPRRLTIQLRLTNHDRSAMPAGLGLHPYFLRPKGARLFAAHHGRWTSTGPVADRRFCRAEPIGQPLDACFIGWSKTARLSLPQRRSHIVITASSSAYALVVYSPKSSNFVCIEPVTNVNDGFNAASRRVGRTGVRVLTPGQGLQLKVSMSVHLSAVRRGRGSRP